MTDTDPADRLHVKRLIGGWGMVADFCFGDLLLFLPNDQRTTPSGFVVVGQVRPTTSQTLYQDDLVGRVVPVGERPLLLDTWTDAKPHDGQNYSLAEHIGVRVTYIPVCRRLDDGSLRVVGVMTRELAPDVSRRPGRLERTYLEVFDALAYMIGCGLFPFPVAEEQADVLDPPRVGDGVIAVGSSGTVSYASPNAMSALHRLGTYANPEGRLLGDLIPGARVLDDCIETGMPISMEIDSAADPSGDVLARRVVLVLRAIPLLHEHEPPKAVVLMRDVSDVRRRDQMLITKDATIREHFNTYRFADHKERVIELLARVTTVSVETMRILAEMPAETL